jgi:hypothetical protein
VAKKHSPVLAVPLEDFNVSMNWMIYGIPGCGKTSLTAKLPNNVYFNCEPGIIAAKRMGSDAEVVQLKNWDMVEEALLAAEDGMYDGAEWITVDTVTTVQQLGYRWQTVRANKFNPKQDIDVPDQGGHQKVQFMTRRFVSRMVDLPINVMFLCHAMATENNDGSTVMMPAIEGQAKKGYAVAGFCMAQMNTVGYMEVREVKKQQQRGILWQTKEDKKKDCIYTAKDNFGVLGTYTRKPDLLELLAKVNAPSVLKNKK